MSYSTPTRPASAGIQHSALPSPGSGDRLPRSLTQQGHNSPNTGNQSAMKPARSYRSLNKDFEKP